jgi:uncharacterized protein Yka (UPF0111/DUF47 family)
MSDVEYILALLNTIQDNVKYTTNKLDHISETMATKDDLKQLTERVKDVEISTDEMKLEVNHYTKVKKTASWIVKVIIVALVGAIITAGVTMPHTINHPIPVSAPFKNHS